MQNNSSIINIGYELIKYYIERRRYTVIMALLEMRPDLIITENLQDVFPLSELEDKVKEFIEKYNKGEVHFSGYWNKDWLYKLHGSGCELKHVLTREFFDWDISDPLIFSKAEFQQHLEWRCLHNKDDKRLLFYLEWIKQNDISLFWDLMQNSKVVKSVSIYEYIFLYDTYQYV